jgi:dihydropyrimidinase
MSAREALAEVAEARDAGRNVFAETCPQYLYLSLEHLGGGFEGAKYVCSPPLRPAADDHQNMLWRGLATDDLQVVATDHCPFCFVEQKELGRDDFSKIPNGLPGVEHRMDLLYQGAVVEGRLGLNRWVEVCATAPAKMFGLFPKKGTIAVGSDADIVVYDPSVRQSLSVDAHHMNVDYSCYEGLAVDGRVALVMSRGRVVIENGEYTGAAGHGRFVKRGLNQLLI